MKLWIDATQAAPNNFIWCKDANEAKYCINKSFNPDFTKIEEIIIGEDSKESGVSVLKYLEQLEHILDFTVNFPIYIHSENSSFIKKIKTIIKKNHWKEAQYV